MNDFNQGDFRLRKVFHSCLALTTIGAILELAPQKYGAVPFIVRCTLDSLNILGAVPLQGALHLPGSTFLEQT